MGKRTWLLGAAIAFMLALAWPSLRSESASALDLFLWLFVLLVVSGVALWPGNGRDQQAEPRLGRRTWADRIEFDDAKATAGSAAQQADSTPTRRNP